jgi:hypothetical protein
MTAEASLTMPNAVGLAWLTTLGCNACRSIPQVAQVHVAAHIVMCVLAVLLVTALTCDSVLFVLHCLLAAGYRWLWCWSGESRLHTHRGDTGTSPGCQSPGCALLASEHPVCDVMAPLNVCVVE